MRIAIYLVLLLCGTFMSCSDTDTSQNADDPLPLTDAQLLDSVQRQTFDYFWTGGEPVSGAARERIHLDGMYPNDDEDVVTSGGTGFGIMATLAAVERGFVTRDEARQRLERLTGFLEKADKYHGAWPHWMFPDGTTKPFSRYDDGGDLVETAFLAQGLIAARQYFIDGTEEEKALAARMDALWKGVEWDWYTKGENVLYWHWSPQHEWRMDFDVRGYNECLIMYILGVASPTHPISPACYHEGFMMDGKIVTDREYYGLPTVLNHYENNTKAVGPLFWAHYSYLGLNPKGLSDKYADWWKLNTNHALIHFEHCRQNPYSYRGYSDSCWGMTSSYSMLGYAGHSPQHDLGVISPTAALSSFPYTPKESMQFLRHLYESHTKVIGKYGPYDAFSIESNWRISRYLAIDQLPIPVMIENYRSGLLWDLFMSAPEVRSGLKELGFKINSNEI